MEDKCCIAASEIRILISIIIKMAGRDLEHRLEASGTGLSSLQYGVLHLISHHQSTLSELSRVMMLAPATLVPVVDALERRGLIRRGTDLKDRRRTPLSATESGAQLLRRVPFVDANDALLASLNRMGEDKSAELLRLLRELAEGMPCHPNLIHGIASAVRIQTEAFTGRAGGMDMDA